MNTEHAQIALALATVSFILSSLIIIIIIRVRSFNVVLKDRTLFNTLLLLLSIETKCFKTNTVLFEKLNRHAAS